MVRKTECVSPPIGFILTWTAVKLLKPLQHHIRENKHLLKFRDLRSLFPPWSYLAVSTLKNTSPSPLESGSWLWRKYILVFGRRLIRSTVRVCLFLRNLIYWVPTFVIGSYQLPAVEMSSPSMLLGWGGLKNVHVQCTLAYVGNATLWHVHVHLHTYGMLHSDKFMCTGVAVGGLIAFMFFLPTLDHKLSISLWRYTYVATNSN